MDVELIKQIVDYIRQLAEPMVTAGYELVLKQIHYIMIRDIVLTVVMVGGLVGLFFLSKKLYDEFDEMLAIMLGLMGGGGLLAGILVNISNILNIAINPDWMAIKLIMSLVGGD